VQNRVVRERTPRPRSRTSSQSFFYVRLGSTADVLRVSKENEQRRDQGSIRVSQSCEAASDGSDNQEATFVYDNMIYRVMHVECIRIRGCFRSRNTKIQLPATSCRIRSREMLEIDQHGLGYIGRTITHCTAETPSVASNVSLSFHESLRLSFHIIAEVPVSLLSVCVP
jgi:hypothetical protein